MNREEIDAMMRELPSQQPEKTTWNKVTISLWLIMFIILCIYAPDIRYQPTEEKTHGNSQENTSQEGCRQGTREESTRQGGQTARGAVKT